MRFTFALLLLFLLIAVSPAAAQTEATQLSELTVELWPDYDRPAMLVLLTGTLPETTSLPATLTIPVPANADIHAVARFNEAGALISDVESSAAGGQLTLTTPGATFRVEYYAPYEVSGSEYSYLFEWISDLTIDSIATVVQQPLAATSITITPEPSGSAADRGDGLNYFRIAPRPLAAGEPYTVEVVYTVDAPVLSAPSQSLPGETATTTPAATQGVLGDLNPFWLLLIPAALVLLGGAWYLGRRQGSGTARPRKPQPSRPAKTGPNSAEKAAPAAKFCHQCGQPAQTGDVFCRKCGTRLKA